MSNWNVFGAIWISQPNFSLSVVFNQALKSCIYSAGLELLKVAIENAGYTGKIKIGMDVAASGMIQQSLNV